MRKIERRLSMNLGSEDGPLTPALSPKGEREPAGRRGGGSWSQCMRKIERRLSMNHWTRRKPGCGADSLSAVSPTGSRQEVIFPATGPIADCQSAIQQTASLRYEGRVQGFNAQFYRRNLSPGGVTRRWRLVTSSPTVVLALFLGVFSIGCNQTNRSQNDQAGTKVVEPVMVDNLEPRRDIQGGIIDAHDGCLQFFNGRFYLYGTAYGLSHNYELTNHSYRVYSSPDLGQWTNEGELLQGQPNGIYFRPYVVFNPKTRKYVLWYNWYGRNLEGQTGVAVSDAPTGPFTIVNPNVRLSHLHPGDGSLFVDDDGTGYYIYTAIGEGYTIRVRTAHAGLSGYHGRGERSFGVGRRGAAALPQGEYLLCLVRAAL